MTASSPAPVRGARNLDSLFSPSSIAIVGASSDPAKFGNWLAVRALRDSANRRPYLVNRSRSEILGQAAYPSLVAIGEPVDLAVIAVPAVGFEAAVDDAISAGVRSIVAMTAGLGESGEAGRARQDALVARLREANVSMLGPNCMGVLDTTSGLDATINQFPPGSISIVSQSGNIAIDLAEQFSVLGLGVARFASVGNGADLDVADLIDSCVDHEGTSAIAVYCEGFQDGRKFARAAERASRAGKPVVLLSVGKGAASTRAAASHTGSMVTSGVVLEAVARATGLELVSSPLEMANLLNALVKSRLPSGRRIGILSDAGGHGAVSSDVLEAAGLQVSVFSTELQATLAAELPPTAAVGNPTDFAGGGEQDITSFTRVCERLTAADEIDAVFMTGYFGGYSQYDPAMLPGEIQAGRDMAQIVVASGKPFVAQTIFSGSEAGRALSDGVAVYRNIEHASWALSRLAQRSEGVASGVPELPPPAVEVVETGYWPARRALAEAGIPFVKAAEVFTKTDLERELDFLRFPLVLKALGDEHKSDAGGVVLNLTDRAAVDLAWSDVQTRLNPPSCSLEEMADLRDAVELIVGVRRDPTFGPVVLVGAGGVLAELLKDMTCALGPVTVDQARALLLSLRVSALLEGYRGKSAVDIDAAAQLVAQLSEYAAAHPEIAEIECNPIAVGPRGATALDARIVLA